MNSQPTNLQTVKDAVMCLINLENTLEFKHDLLTDIGIGSRHPLTFRACEDIRNELPDSSDHEVGASDSVESGHRGPKVRNVLRKKPSNEIPGERSSRQELDAILATLNAISQKTFVFEGVTFSLPLVKKFMGECKKLPELAVTVAENAMLLKWKTGNAKINSFEFSEKIKADKILKDLLK